MAKVPNKANFKTELTQSPEASGWHFLVISPKILTKFSFEDKSKRVVCSINGGEAFQCALMPSGEMFFIMVNKKKRDVLGIVAGDTVSVELVKDESKYGLPMPEEFREVLDQDPEGDKVFHALTAGKQRSLLYFVGNIKDIDKRIHQSLVIMEHLKEHGKVVDKVLYDELRRPMF